MLSFSARSKKTSVTELTYKPYIANHPIVEVRTSSHWGVTSPVWLVLVCFLGIRSVIDPFASVPFPRLFDIYVLIVGFFALFTTRRISPMVSIWAFLLSGIILFIVLVNSDGIFSEQLFYFKLIQYLVAGFLLQYFLDYSDETIETALSFALLVNIIFILYQVISGQFYGVERTFESRAASFIEPAIGASGFTLGVISIFFFLRERYIRSLSAIILILMIGSGAAFIFTCCVLLAIMLKFLKTRFLGRAITLLCLFVTLIYFVIYFFNDIRFIQNIMHRSGVVIDILINGSFHLLGNRWINWNAHFAEYPVSMFGYGIGTTVIIDNMIIKLTTDLGLIVSFLYVGFLLFILIRCRKNALLVAVACLVLLMSLSHDILSAIRVCEVVFAGFVLYAIGQRQSKIERIKK